MRKSNKQSLIHNLSATKYCFPAVCETALGQLDHYFCTIGNDVDYDSKRGLKEEDHYSGKRYFIAEPHEFDFTPVLAKREEQRQVLIKEYNRMVEIFGDNVPGDIGNRLNEQLAELDKPFEVMDSNYYFSFNRMGGEMIDFVRKQIKDDPHHRFYIRTPYPLSEYSILSKMTRDDNPLMVQLARTMCKSWIEVLGVYIQQEWYLTAEDVEKYQGASYYYSLEYINKCIENFERIIVNLSVESEND